VALLPAALGCVATLPVAAETDARLVPHRQPYSAINLAAVRIAPVIFSPCCFLREPDQIRAGDVVVVCPISARRIREKKPSAVLVLMSYSPPRL
jgi:hypothetical protein